MRLFDENDDPINNTYLDNLPLTLSVSEGKDYAQLVVGPNSYNVRTVIAYAENNVGVGHPYYPDPDGDHHQEAIINFKHEIDRSLRFQPLNPPIVFHDAPNMTYTVEYPVPAMSGDPEYNWDGSIKIYDTTTSPASLKKTIPLKVTVRKGGPG